MEINPANSGAISELLVSADLLSKGYQVFRSVSASATFDIAAYKDNKFLRVEVRTGYLGADNSYSYPIKDVDVDRFDLLAVVLRQGTGNNQIVYLAHDQAIQPLQLRKTRNKLKYYVYEHTEMPK